MCDTDKNGSLSKKEAHACIDEHVSDADEAEEIKEMVDEVWDYLAGSDDEVDQEELEMVLGDEEESLA